MNTAHILNRTARIFGNFPAVADGATVLCNYAGLRDRAVRDRVARLAGGMIRTFGLVPGDRVAILARNVPHYIETLLTTWWAGLVVMPINSKLHADEVAYIIEDSGAKLCSCCSAKIATGLNIAARKRALTAVVELVVGSLRHVAAELRGADRRLPGFHGMRGVSISTTISGQLPSSFTWIPTPSV